MSQRKSGTKSKTSLSQQTLEASFAEATVNTEELANNVVRYIVYRAGEHMNFSKAELVKNVIHRAGNKYEEIINMVRNILKTVYGLNIIVCDSTKGKDKHYVISSLLPYFKDPTENAEDIPDDVNKILLLLILSHIFMSNNSVSDVSLYGFLKSVGIDVEHKHPIFGNVMDYINKTLTKNQYVLSEVENMSKRQTFKWGVRAEKEISKMRVLDFVCKIYKDRQPKDWVNQFQVAGQQEYENHPESRNTEE